MIRRSSLGLAFTTTIIFVTVAQAQTSWHVDIANCPRPGSGSEVEAFCSIQSGIDVATNGDEVIVATGTYHETIDFNGKAITLRSCDGPNVTIIDGTGKNDSVVKCVSGEGSETVLQGLTITGGMGNLTTGFSVGGGMYNRGSSPTVIDCVFQANTVSGESANGGGMFNDGASPTVVNCVFQQNSASGSNASGGGMSNFNRSMPTITDCMFVENSASFSGGGMNNSLASPSVVGCTFEGNSASSGGGVSNLRAPLSLPELYPSFTKCRLSDNTAGTGAGMYNRESSPPVTNCVFLHNAATIAGGGMYNIAVSNPLLANCMFNGNSASSRGGGIRNNHSSPMVVNCTFSRNTAGINGGGLSNDVCSVPKIINCIVWGNTDSGGQNEPAQIQVEAIAFVIYSCVQGGWTGNQGMFPPGFDMGDFGLGGEGNIDLDPLFLDADGADGVAGTEDDDFRLSLGSPCVDVADNSAIALCAVDLDGHSRRTDDPATPDGGLGNAPMADMGAYELGGLLADCNANVIDDTCDIADGSSEDSDNNGVPDECERPTGPLADDGDCNRNQSCTASIDCDDDDSCTQDTCQGGTCVNSVIVCDDGLFCNGQELCEEGQCIAGQDSCPQNQVCNEDEDVCDIRLCGAMGDGALATAITVALGFSLLGFRRRPSRARCT